MKILLLEDNQAIATALVSLLAPSDYEITPTLSGIDALATLKQGKAFDLIMLDMNLPLMDGRTFLEERAALPEPIPSLPVVVFTSDKTVMQRDLAALGVIEVLYKPADSQEIKKVLSRVMRKAARAPRTSERGKSC